MTPTATSSSTGTAPTPDYNDFLQLLMAQLKNQDPTKPVDSTEYMSQLASFSNVEQAIKTNTKLDSLLSSLTMQQATGVIGKTIASNDGSLSGVVTGVKIYSDGATAILDNGQEVLLGPGITITSQ
jgi:flagellar basal-body rod modification protein FlgD